MFLLRIYIYIYIYIYIKDYFNNVQKYFLRNNLILKEIKKHEA